MIQIIDNGKTCEFKSTDDFPMWKLDWVKEHLPSIKELAPYRCYQGEFKTNLRGVEIHYIPHSQLEKMKFLMENGQHNEVLEQRIKELEDDKSGALRNLFRERKLRIKAEEKRKELTKVIKEHLSGIEQSFSKLSKITTDWEYEKEQYRDENEIDEDSDY